MYAPCQLWLTMEDLNKFFIILQFLQHLQLGICYGEIKILGCDEYSTHSHKTLRISLQKMWKQKILI
jgi:hypothetical protein